MSDSRFYAGRLLRRNQTPSELVLWQAVRDRQFQGLKFRRQHPIGRFVLDFYCAEHRLAVEIDGGIHLDRDVREGDEARDEILLTEVGIRTLRIPADEVESNIVAALARISEFITQDPPSPPQWRGAGGEVGAPEPQGMKPSTPNDKR